MTKPMLGRKNSPQGYGRPDGPRTDVIKSRADDHERIGRDQINTSGCSPKPLLIVEKMDMHMAPLLSENLSGRVYLHVVGIVSAQNVSILPVCPALFFGWHSPFNLSIGNAGWSPAQPTSFRMSEESALSNVQQTLVLCHFYREQGFFTAQKK